MLRIFSQGSKLYSPLALRLSELHSLPFKGNFFHKNVHISSYKKSFFRCPNSLDYSNHNMLKTSSVLYLQYRGYAMRLELSEYGIIWKRPEKIASWTPEASGDLLPLEDIDKTKPIVSLLNIADEIATADEKTQSLLSIEFGSDQEVRKMAKYRMKRRVQRHKYDEDSPEVKIALQTVDIRYFQKVVAADKKLVRLRVRLQELIDSRNRRLTNLRKLDYKRFEWLLEQLEVAYKPRPRIMPKITRKSSLQNLVTLHCNMIREERLEKYRKELEAMKKPFLEEKRQTLKWIAETERKLGVPVSVQVSDQEETKLIECSNSEESKSTT